MPRATTKQTPLQKAFNAIAKQRIIAAHDFGCCSDCAQSELDEHILSDTLGYIFYPSPQTETAQHTGVLQIEFHATSNGSLLGVAARTIVCLEKAGLKTTWSGDISQPIQVTLSESDKVLLRKWVDARNDRLTAACGAEHRLRQSFVEWKRIAIQNAAVKVTE